jgi:hypothetical protein
MQEQEHPQGDSAKREAGCNRDQDGGQVTLHRCDLREREAWAAHPDHFSKRML